MIPDREIARALAKEIPSNKQTWWPSTENKHQVTTVITMPILEKVAQGLNNAQTDEITPITANDIYDKLTSSDQGKDRFLSILGSELYLANNITFQKEDGSPVRLQLNVPKGVFQYAAERDAEEAEEQENLHPKFTEALAELAKSKQWHHASGHSEIVTTAISTRDVIALGEKQNLNPTAGMAAFNSAEVQAALGKKLGWSVKVIPLEENTGFMLAIPAATARDQGMEIKEIKGIIISSDQYVNMLRQEWKEKLMPVSQPEERHGLDREKEEPKNKEKKTSWAGRNDNSGNPLGVVNRQMSAGRVNENMRQMEQ